MHSQNPQPSSLHTAKKSLKQLLNSPTMFFFLEKVQHWFMHNVKHIKDQLRN
jgi:hypothetical protein